MTRIEKIQNESIDPKFTEFYSAVESLLGRVPNFYKTLSNSPYLAMAFLPINALAQREWEGTDISGKLKEMIVIKTSHTNGCKYCYAHNTSLGKAAGITDEQIKAISLNEFSDSSLFEKEEILALKWAEAVTLNKAAKNDALFTEMSAVFSEKQIAEMTILCAMFNMINRINDSLDVDLEDNGEIDKIQRSLVLEPKKMTNYLTWLSGFWKKEF
ncbi:MAG: carboxymuconolactone decarboxylase family protein [Alphaproteobacteria bacterium]|nr:carboxymuconolactone decarboxylase family protein [Alphaproteobacteria bacterium]MDC3311790.1 carboxymuconolactone decarboxylase family protein [Alphaproteobacteria bacterium]